MIAEQRGIDEGEVTALGILAVADGRLHGIAGAVEIAVADLDFGEPAVGGRITAGDEEVAGRLVDRLDIEDHTVGRRPRPRRDLDGLEVVQVLQPPLGAVDQDLVIGIALTEIELATNHVVARAAVAVDLDAFDIGSLALVDHEGDVDALRNRVARHPRRRVGKGITELRHLDGECIGGLVQRGAVETRTGLHKDKAAQPLRVEPGHVADHVDLAEAVRLAFVDGEGDRESLGCRIVFGVRIRDAGVRIAVAAIVESDLLAVLIDAIGIVNIAAGEETQHRAGRCLDDGVELTVAEGVIAGEVDLLHRRLLALGDGENEIDAVVAAIDDLRHHADIVASDAAVSLDDAVDVVLNDAALQRTTRLGLHSGGEIGVLDLFVALERDAPEYLGLGDMHDKAARRLVDRHLVE